ncbi:hypothetical protein OEZ71_08530 [Defluviimonas sp. WL0050]|uniref:RiboL-PSP-HEPN domain-containing protein n=1 Tax=Albidovulum litorale TaxID=2984134 RepID=A0ABT2ZMI1_9RHOB|nr:hypothetical protein [Defluviimonas sp. WL0050]MCV2872339.1 hypothetical protein [Defluviimonas sp. WL0050]
MQMSTTSDKDAIEKLKDQFPILLFSLSTQVQIQALTRTRQLIENSIEVVKTSDNSSTVNGNVAQAYDLFWLWTLGAYEVTRTMCQNKACFDPSLHQGLLDLKHYLAELRMPFAKQELARSGQPVSRENSITGIHEQLGMAFEVRGVVYHTIEVMDRFTRFVAKIKREQILRRID